MTGRPFGHHVDWNHPRRMVAHLTVLTVMLGSLAGLTVAAPAGAPAGAQVSTLGGCSPPTITSASSATATAGVPFSFTVTTCSTSVPVFKASGLPGGLILTNNEDGTATIAGSPRTTDSGIYNARITAVVKGLPAAEQTYVVTVDNAPRFISRATCTAHTGTSFTCAITTRYGYPLPAISTSSGLPAGVSLTGTGGSAASLGGTPGPNAGGVYHLSLVAASGSLSATQSFTLTVYQAPMITSAPATSGVAGQSLTPFPVTDTGYPVPALRATGLPSGVSLVSGVIQGTPKASGTFPVTITAKSAAGTTSQSFTLTVGGSLGLNQPTAITEDQGFMWITNTGNNTLTKLNLSGSLVSTLSGPSYGFNDPVAVAGNGTDLFVVNNSGSVTEINEASGALVQILQGTAYALSRPNAILIDGQDAWVTNNGDNSVTEFDTATGAPVRVLTNQGNPSYSFDDPVALGAVGSDIWVVNGTGASTSDPLAGSVTVIDGTTGSFVQRVSAPGDGFESPAGVAYSSGNVWVTDSASYQVTELTPSGSLVQVITNSSNDANYGFDHPTAIVATAGDVYVDSPPGSSPMITEVNSATAEGDWYECNTNTPDPLFNNPTGLVVTGSDAWVVSPGDNTLTELDLSAGGEAVGWYS